MLADILSVKVFEASESLAVKENQDGDDLGIGKPSRLIAMLLAITELMLFEFRRKILAVIIGKTENFYTIESIEPSLNPPMFFKATRGCIISIGSIAKVSKYFNSRLKVSLKHNASMDLMISRARVQDFFKWLDG